VNVTLHGDAAERLVQCIITWHKVGKSGDSRNQKESIRNTEARSKEIQTNAISKEVMVTAFGPVIMRFLWICVAMLTL
jgi:hypothetical protein